MYLEGVMRHLAPAVNVGGTLFYFYLYYHTDQHNKRWKQEIRGTKSIINHITNMCEIIRLIKAGFLKYK